MLYLVYYDDTPKRTTAQKLAEACAAYEKRFGSAPTLILVNEADAGTAYPGCVVQVERRVAVNTFQVGQIA